MRAQLRAENLSRVVADVKKCPINDRIRATDILINQGRLFYTEDSEIVKKALCEAQWDAKSELKDKRLDDKTSDIDSLDAFEYSFLRDMSALINYDGKLRSN